LSVVKTVYSSGNIVFKSHKTPARSVNPKNEAQIITITKKASGCYTVEKPYNTILNGNGLYLIYRDNIE